MREEKDRVFPAGFFLEMEGKRKENTKKGGWVGMGLEELMRLLKQEEVELRAEIIWLNSSLELSEEERQTALVRIQKEAADVGNFAGFIWDVAEQQKKKKED